MQRRRSGDGKPRLSKSMQIIGQLEGEKPADMVLHYTKLTSKQKQTMHDQLTAPTRINCKGFIENKEKNRALIPIHEKKRVMLPQFKEGDSEYVPATYASYDREDFIIIQAPTKTNYKDFWRIVETDATKCYPYWPTKEKEKMNIEVICTVYRLRAKNSKLNIASLNITIVKDGRFVIQLKRKQNYKGYVTYDMEIVSTDPTIELGDKAKSTVNTQAAIKFFHFFYLSINSDIKSDSVNEDEGDEDKKPRSNWAQDTWPDIELLAPFVQALSKKEVQVNQGRFDRYFCFRLPSKLFRTAIIWVGAILMKDIEKRECFDIEDLVRKLTRIRPGVFHNRIYYCILFALAFRLAALGGWSNYEVRDNREE
uniref:Tyrosine-protein phosphatase domain-containing protein n=1 Tax=Heterorhabditis bacteriophora TaxID=37862 RepID=A0A1I7XH95_HETBA